MKLPRSLSKLLENKYVLYIVFFLAVTNVFGYLITQNLKAVGLFILIGYLVYFFNKNMIVVLGVPLIFTALYVSTGAHKEGFEEGKNPETAQLTRTTTAAAAAATTTDGTLDDPVTQGSKQKMGQQVVGKGIVVENAKTADPPAVEGEEKQSYAKQPDGLNVIGAKRVTDFKFDANLHEGQSTRGDGEGMTGYRKKAPRLDYASTVEDAYGDLNQILGGDGIKRLTDDTQKLMNQQLQLADAMQSLTPLLTQAKSLVGSFDLKNLGGLADLAKQFGAKN